MKAPSKKIIFITGTDTGVGKTLLTALLLYHLRQNATRTLAMKPFCSGSLGDVRLLQSLQKGELSDREMNPFYFAQPVAPLAAAKKNQTPSLGQVIQSIRAVENKCDQLLVEGSGGLMVPLGKGYTVADLITKLNCRVIVVARNQLGTINHTLLTLNALKANGIRAKNISVVLMASRNPDASSRTNKRMISIASKPVQVFSLPFLKGNHLVKKGIAEKHEKARTLLNRLSE